jgi:alpha-amylase
MTRLGIGLHAALAAVLLGACMADAPAPEARTDTAASAAPAGDDAVFWNASTVYFLLTDRFENGDSTNDRAGGRAQDGAVLRSFAGGDFAGVRRRLEAGYFDSLGVNVLWLTPFVEQIRGSVDEGTGKSYGFHGYWTRDWTAVEPTLGTVDELRALVDAAHRRGMRILMDAVINHTGPVTPLDPVWPTEWVRTEPRCAFRDYASTVDCTLVANLPDIRTERDEPVELPPSLEDKWRQEGRLEAEQAELDAFFERTGYPRAPRYYVIKWLTDWVRELGIDGYRVDTAKHFEESVAAELEAQAEIAFADWKAANPDQVLDSLSFFMMGEVYGWAATAGRDYDFGDRAVDFFDYGYDGMINFDFKHAASAPSDSQFARYAALLRGPLEGIAIVNYLSSHDDGSPWDPDRAKAMEAGTRLLLSPGGAQIYYGDELARPLRIDGAEGDANLRSFMNWSDLEQPETAALLRHWRTLGRFRRAHPAVGAGEHRVLSDDPFVFSRTLDADGTVDRVVVAMNVTPGTVTIPVGDVFADGTVVVDAYSGESGTVAGGAVTLTTQAGLVLLAERR